MLTSEGRKRQLLITKRTIIADLTELNVLDPTDKHKINAVGMKLDAALVHLITRILDFDEDKHGFRTVA